jgi:hypothetical protein
MKKLDFNFHLLSSSEESNPASSEDNPLQLPVQQGKPKAKFGNSF